MRCRTLQRLISSACKGPVPHGCTAPPNQLSGTRLTCCAAKGRSWCQTPGTAVRLPLWVRLPPQHIRSKHGPCSSLLLNLSLLLCLLLFSLLPPQQTPLFALLSPFSLALSTLCSLCLQPQQPTCVPKPVALALKSSIASQQVLLVQRSAWLRRVIPQQTGLIQQLRAVPLLASSSRIAAEILHLTIL